MNDLKLGDKGARVVELQKNLQRAGFKLPRFGADGSLGRETLDAVDAFAGATTTDATPNDTVPYALELKIKEAQAQPVAIAPTTGTPQELAPGFVDARAWYNGKDFTTRNPWGRIDTICLHQMAVNGNAGWKRWDGLAIHVAVCTKGPAALLNDLDKRVAHGHAWNSRSVGFEIEGLAAKPYTGR